jgi:PTS system fructose-specific IIA component/PTS system nitrogen regulatory IIA component
MKLSEFLVPEAIITDLAATTKEAAIREIVRSVQGAGHLAGVDAEVLTEAFMKRVELGSTGIGYGVAVPHGGHAAVDRAFGTIALSRQGVEFNSLDGKPVDIIVLICHEHDAFAGKPVNTSRLYDFFYSVAPYLKDERFLDRLRACRTREEVVDFLGECDQQAY